MNLRDIREALAEDAASATGIAAALSYLPVKVVADQLPLAVVGNPDTIAYNRTFGRGHATITLRVTALVTNAADPEAGTALLDAFVSAELANLAAALRQEQSTDERPWVVNVGEADNFGLFKFESVDYLGVQLVVTVIT